MSEHSQSLPTRDPIRNEYITQVRALWLGSYRTDRETLERVAAGLREPERSHCGHLQHEIDGVIARYRAGLGRRDAASVSAPRTQ